MKKQSKIFKIILASIIGVALFLVAAKFIVVDSCASPCRHNNNQGSAAICPDVCEKVTLLDLILGNG